MADILFAVFFIVQFLSFVPDTSHSLFQVEQHPLAIEQAYNVTAILGLQKSDNGKPVKSFLLEMERNTDKRPIVLAIEFKVTLVIIDIEVSITEG